MNDAFLAALVLALLGALVFVCFAKQPQTQQKAPCCCPDFAFGECYDVILYPPGASIGTIEVVSSSGGTVQVIFTDLAGQSDDDGIWIGAPEPNDPLCRRQYGQGGECQFLFCDPVGPPECSWKWVDCVNNRTGYLKFLQGCP